MRHPEPAPRFEKEEVELPDGRRLVYYWFPQAPQPGRGVPSGDPGARRPPTEET